MPAAPAPQLPLTGALPTPETTTPTFQPASWEDVIRAAAKAHKVNPALALAVARKESSLDPNAKGDIDPKTGQPLAIGFFQLHDAAAKDVNIPDRSDPVQNAIGGAKYLRRLSDRYKGDVTKMLHAYNGGMDNVDKGIVSPAAQSYAANLIAELSGTVRENAAGAVAEPAQFTSPLLSKPSTPGSLAARIRQGITTANESMHAPAPSLREMVVKPYDPRTREGRVNDAAAAAGLVTTILTRNLKVGGGVATAIARVLAPAVASGAASGVEAQAENGINPGGPQVNPWTTAGIQAAYDIGGQAFMWPIRKFLRGAIAHQVAVAATTGLEAKAEATVLSTQAESRAVRDRLSTEARDVRNQVADIAHGITQATRGTMRAAREGTGAVVQQAKSSASRLISGVTDTARSAVTAAKTRAAEITANAELESTRQLKAAQAAYDNLLAQPPSKLGGKVVTDVLQGPAARAIKTAGQAVGESVKTGPPLPYQPVRDTLTRLARQWRPAEVFASVHDATTQGARAQMPNIVGAASAPFGRGAMSMDQYTQLVRDYLDSLPKGVGGGAIGTPADIPRFHGLLGKMQDVEAETIPFETTHTLLRLLDDSVDWDKVSANTTEQITKAARISVRKTMAAANHEPYETAARVYHAIIPIYRKGIGKKLAALATTPDGMAKMATTLNTGDPAQAQILKQLLVTQAAEGGNPALGLQAWDLVRSHHTYDKLLNGGIDGLGERLTNLTTKNPEFAKIVYGDATGATILTNLGKIADAASLARAFEAEQRVAAKAAGAKAVAAAKSTGRNAIEQAKLIGGASRDEAGAVRTAVLEDVKAGVSATRSANAAEGQQQIAKQARSALMEKRAVDDAGTAARGAVKSEINAFNKSPVAKFTNRTPEAEAADIGRALILAPHASYWGIQSLLRLMRGPTGAQLLAWSSYSSPNTQRIVRALSAPGLDVTVMTALLRDIGGVLMNPAISDPNAAKDAQPARPTTPAAPTARN